MPLLRCPKFLRCPATDACNFERGYSLILFLPPSAALDLRPTSARLVCTPPPHTVGATLAVARPGSHRTYCHTPVGRGALTPPPSSHCVIAKPVRTLAVAICAPCTALSSSRKGHSPPPPRKNAVRPQWSHRMKGGLQFFAVFNERRGQDIHPA